MAGPRHNEDAFSLVELLVVMIIIAVLAGVAMYGLKGARSAGGQSEVVAAARRYSDAVDRYQQEHQRQVPVIAPGSVSWPQGAVNAGPIYTLQVGGPKAKQVSHPYLKGGRAPAVMTKGATAGAVLRSGNPCPSVPAQGGLIVYRTGAAGAAACGPKLDSQMQYSIRVFWRGKFVCDLGDAATKPC